VIDFDEVDRDFPGVDDRGRSGPPHILEEGLKLELLREIQPQHRPWGLPGHEAERR
jgi:hypothetical protein